MKTENGPDVVCAFAFCRSELHFITKFFKSCLSLCVDGMFWRDAHQMIYSTDIEHRHSLCNTDASWRRRALSYIEVMCVEGGDRI